MCVCVGVCVYRANFEEPEGRSQHELQVSVTLRAIAPTCVYTCTYE